MGEGRSERLGEALALHSVRRGNQHHRGFRLAGVPYTFLILEDLLHGGRGDAEVSGGTDVEPRLDCEIRQEGVEGGDIAAVTVDDEYPLEAVLANALEEAEQHRPIG